MTTPSVKRREATPPFGLAFVPTLEPEFPDTQDYFPGHLELRPKGRDNSDAVLEMVAASAATVRPGAGILELGVALYPEAHSFTPRLIRNKPSESVYLGVDVADRGHVTRYGPNAHFLRSDTKEQSTVRGRLRTLGVEPLGLLLIDGDHSVNGALNDWLYVDLVEPGGVVLIHDTNSHPGPVALVAAVDGDVFDIEEPLKGLRDYGVAILRRK